MRRALAADWSSPIARVREPASRVDVAACAVLFLTALGLYRASAPAVVNPDGLGYLKQMAHNYAAGHLLYLPLLRAVTALSHGNRLVAGLRISVCAGATAIALFFGSARALLPRGAAGLAAAGLLVSYGAWVQGADVEVYACALAALLATFALALVYGARPSIPGAIATGVALGVAVLFHLTNVMATPFVVALVARRAPGRRRALLDGALTMMTGGVLSLAAYAYAALSVRQLDLPGALRWILTASHGFPYSGTVLARLADGVYGLSRALVWSPYLHASNAQILLAQFLLGLTAVAMLVGFIWTGRAHLASLPRLPLSLWLATYAAMALAFFGSDHERWLFALPPLWLLAAAGAWALARGSSLLATLVLLLFIENRTAAIVPAQRDSWDRTLADAAAALMRDGDLAIFPGHAWDEYIGFYTGTQIEPFPLAYYAGLLGRDGCLRLLEREIAARAKASAHVFVARVFDPRDDDRRGFYELERLGLPREELLRALEPARFRPRPTRVPKVTVWELRSADRHTPISTSIEPSISASIATSTTTKTPAIVRGAVGVIGRKYDGAHRVPRRAVLTHQPPL